MRKTLCSLLGALVAVFWAAPVGAAPVYKVLGMDAELDAPPSFDLTELAVRKMGRDLQIMIGLNGMTPPWGSAIPLLPGVQWSFEVKGKTFVAEAYTDPTSDPGFLLFQKKGEVFTQLATLKGTYNWEDEFVSMRVPLKKIGAKRGTRISGVGKKGTGGSNDVDFHVHHADTYYADYLSTNKDFVVP
jgi:hypothetical protein